MIETQPLTLTELVLHLRSQLLALLEKPATPENRALLTGLWRTCLTIHDLAEVRHNHAYLKLMERMIDAVADYEQIDHPEGMDWKSQLPTIAEIEAAGAK